MRALDVVAILLLILLVVDWASTMTMLRLRNAAPRNTALASRTFSAFVLSMVATLAAILAVAELLREQVPPVMSTVIIAGSFLLVSVPQVHWLWLYLRGNWQ